MQRMTTARIAIAALVVASILCVNSARAQAQVVTNIATDGSLGDPAHFEGEPGVPQVFEIGESHGARPGGSVNLFHSFGTFNVGAGDTALFTADPSKLTDNVVSRVTRGTQSDIYGTIACNIDGNDLYLLNPSGILFGSTSSLNVLDSFHVGLDVPLHRACGLPPLRDSEIFGHLVCSDVSGTSEHHPSRVVGSTTRIEAFDRRRGARALLIGAEASQLYGVVVSVLDPTPPHVRKTKLDPDRCLIGRRSSMPTGVSWDVMMMLSLVMFGAAFCHLVRIACSSSGPRFSHPPSIS
jgi:filamentous hemagglutinin family protein